MIEDNISRREVKGILHWMPCSDIARVRGKIIVADQGEKQGCKELQFFMTHAVDSVYLLIAYDCFFVTSNNL
jgi:hypothetical protein